VKNAVGKRQIAPVNTEVNLTVLTAVGLVATIDTVTDAITH